MKASFFVVLSLALVPRVALAALTSSEKAVVRTFVEKGAVDTAPRVRALVARPDLGPAEIAEPLKKGFVTVPFDVAHAQFTDALLFGPGSDAARDVLVPAVVEALLARANARMGDVAFDAGHPATEPERGAVDELLRIHAFVDRKIANAGHGPLDGHDPQNGIRDDAYQACALLYKSHWAAFERWLGPSGPMNESMVRLRSQIALTLIDLARGGPSRNEVGEWIELKGARRAAFERDGVLVQTGGAAPEARIADDVRLLETVPGAAAGLSLWLLDKTNPTGLVGRGNVVRVGVPLTDALRPTPATRLFSDDVTSVSPDVAFAEAAGSVAMLATEHAFAQKPSLGERARAATARAVAAGIKGFLAIAPSKFVLPADGGGALGAPSPELVLAGAVQLLLIDAPRAIDLAVIGAAEGFPGRLEQLAIALSILAADGKHAPLGKTRADGSVEAVDATDVAFEGDVVSGFSFAGKRFTIGAGKDGGFIAQIDGAAPRLTSLASYHPHVEASESWSVGLTTYQKLFGEPRAVGLDDGRFLVEGSHAGLDAIAAGPSAADVEVTATVLPSGAGGGLLVRGSAAKVSYTAVTLRLLPESGKAELLFVDSRGQARELGPSTDLPKPMPPKGYLVALRVAGDKVTGKVGNRTLTGTLEQDVPEGRAGLFALAEGHLEIRDFKVKPVKAAR